LKKTVALSLLLAFTLLACATSGKHAGLIADKKTALFLKSNNYLEKLKLSGTAQFIGREHSTSTKAILIIERPKKIRLVFLSPIGTTLLLAVSDGQKFSIVIPSAKINDTRVLKGNDVIKIGGVGFPMEEFIRFVTPSIEESWLKGGKARVTGNRMKVNRKEGQYDFFFYGSGKMKSVDIKKKGLPKFRVEYFYRGGSRVEVLVNGVIRFKFDTIKSVKEFDGSPFLLRK